LARAYLLIERFTIVLNVVAMILSLLRIALLLLELVAVLSRVLTASSSVFSDIFVILSFYLDLKFHAVVTFFMIQLIAATFLIAIFLPRELLTALDIQYQFLSISCIIYL
jgi:hypothetical protein